MKCKHCNFILKTFDKAENLSKKEYWLMTEVFVYLHGSDSCELKNQFIKLQIAVKEAKQFLKSEISTRLKTQSYRDLEKITGLNSKQLQRINSDKFPHFESVLRAIQGLLYNSKPTKPKKRRE